MAKRRWYELILLLLALTGCIVTPEVLQSPLGSPLDSPVSAPSELLVAETELPDIVDGTVVISEFLPGIPGNNNAEFVELYNTGTVTVDLRGWSLWYRLADNQEEQLIYAWEESAQIPGLGHYLLVQLGEDVGTLPDAEYATPLLDKKGGLVLRDAAGERVDALGWGNAPTGYVEGEAAVAASEGASLERLPGGDLGNGIDGDDNAEDFILNDMPYPQNSGSLRTPQPAKRLELDLRLPPSVEPGSTVEYTVEVRNLTGRDLEALRVSVPMPPMYEILSGAEEGIRVDGHVAWSVTALAEGAVKRLTLTLQAPWTYATDVVGGGYVEASNWPLRAYGPLQRVVIEGGSIPIGTARTLLDQKVVVEGIATMYTDGFFAGSTGTKFYVEDETGGVQVYCPGGKGLVEVDLGERVRVTGEVQLYRGAVEIVPEIYPDDVEVDEAEPVPVEPVKVSLTEFGQDEDLLGRLIALEGVITRIQEFTYSYEVDLTDEVGNTALIYVDKETGLDVELLEVGKQYRVTGIAEIYGDKWELLPRVQEDFEEIFPPELMLEMAAPNSVLPGDLITYTLTAYNHTDTTLTNVFISASLPTNDISISEIFDGGVLEGAEVTWTLPELESNGGNATVSYSVRAGEDAQGRIVFEGAVATAAEWSEPVVTTPYVTFVGAGVPIWAIQGPGMESPYVRGMATAEGVVTGVFPELGGFWIQSLVPDDDPATSEGIFVLTETLQAELLEGETRPTETMTASDSIQLQDQVVVRGRVRERSGQTLLDLVAPPSIVSNDNPLPVPVELDPPSNEVESLLYYEALEGMFVQVSDPAVVVAPTSQYGEYVLVRRDWDIARVMRGEPTGMMIFVDDGSSVTHNDGSTLPYTVKTGDIVFGLLGPLAFTYDNYKVQPVVTPTVTASTLPLPSLEPVNPNQFSIATFNVENAFDALEPHPSDPPRPSVTEYHHKLTKLAEAVVAMGYPTIIGLQEVENVGILEDLVEQEAIAEVGYIPILIEGADSRGIDNGYLVRGDRATVEGSSAHPAPGDLMSRPPLFITVTVEMETGSQRIYLFNNHFTSMSAGEEATEPRRAAQADWNATLVQQLLARDPEALVVVMGDLNSFYDSVPLDVLREGGLRHVYEFVEPDLPYSYIYQGESETLDHILVTPSLYEYLTGVVALHINADYPPSAPDDASPRRVSDHDPVLAVFTFE